MSISFEVSILVRVTLAGLEEVMRAVINYLVAAVVGVALVWRSGDWLRSCKAQDLG